MIHQAGPVCKAQVEIQKSKTSTKQINKVQTSQYFFCICFCTFLLGSRVRSACGLQKISFAIFHWFYNDNQFFAGFPRAVGVRFANKISNAKQQFTTYHSCL